MTKLNIGGVPEHFNLPWHLAIENGEFKEEGIDLIWRDYPEGTGAMCKALREKEIDIAIILTGGIIKDITNGNPSKIVQTYINTPLLWGIHVGAESSYESVADLEGKRPAISRFGSGSQLLAIVNAQKNGWNSEELDYKIVGNLNGGAEALTNGEADYFLWEHFTTKPLVDNGTFRRVGNCPTPWPCFVIAVREEVLENHYDEVKSVLKVINSKVKSFSTHAKKNRYTDLFSMRYNLEKEDVKDWLSITEWNQGKPISKTLIKSIQNKLIDFNVIETKVGVDELVKKIYI
jgi:ABC-type nitrate/sulfonate/bicarbonate transport system substrate-binding protein